MIVMKFGGASLASPASIRRVASIVLSEVSRTPIVVASAIGDTTDHLLRILEHASRAESYLAWKLQEQLRTCHFCLAEDLLGEQNLEPVDQYIRQVFRDLHVRVLELCEENGRSRPSCATGLPASESACRAGSSRPPCRRADFLRCTWMRRS